MRVSFLIPAYNEAATIGEVLDRIDALQLDKAGDRGRRWVDPRHRGGRFSGERLFVVLPGRANQGKGAADVHAITHIDGDIAVIHALDMEYYRA